MVVPGTPVVPFFFLKGLWCGCCVGGAICRYSYRLITRLCNNMFNFNNVLCCLIKESEKMDNRFGRMHGFLISSLHAFEMFAMLL